MGSTLTSVLRWWTDEDTDARSEPVRILLLGLDGAGKTTLLCRLVTGQVIDTTVCLQSVHIETVCSRYTAGLSSFAVWDMPGAEKFRPFWRHYLHLAQGILYMVDSSDLDRLPESKDTLHELLHAPELLTHVPVLVLANKQDVTGTKTVAEVSRLLQLDTLTGRLWAVEGTSVLQDSGLHRSLRVLDSLVKLSCRQTE